MKLCLYCLESKELFDFPNQSKIIDKKSNRCKKCQQKQIVTKKASLLNINKIQNKTCNKCLEKNAEFYGSIKSYCKKCFRSIRNKNYKKNKTKELLYYNNRRKVDQLFRIKCNLRSRLHSFLTKNKNFKKNVKFSEYIGCNFVELKLYLQKQFTEGMTWENYGKWHIDHIIPLSSAKTEEEMYKLCHFSNLQPLWALDNIRKGCKING